jgi:hypothetical protein
MSLVTDYLTERAVGFEVGPHPRASPRFKRLGSWG